MKVDVYLNLHLSTVDGRVYSIRSREKGSDYGKVVAYSSTISLRDCQFIVSEKGQARVRKEKAKLVHAVIRGTLIDFTEIDSTVSVFIGYCPYQTSLPSFYRIDTPKFSTTENKSAINRANRVNCLPNSVIAIP